MAALLLILATAQPIQAAAQWMWRDASGKAVFSDRPPPNDIPDKNVLQRPSNVQRQAAAAPAVPAAAAPAASRASEPAPPSGQDKELEQRRQQAENAEAAKLKAAQEAQLRARAENCARARQNKANLDSGMRIARTNAQGEREFLDDAARAAEVRRSQDVIARDCGPAAVAQ
ncbi:DUF4124 domain-containing protein [Pseudorhodoferax sp.]|uniref:DUF4124 domain-containing protein n=1 Tax=Pseudorhodoferax sp. TaxID=1993553 RepID=UPI002DD67266|nr:DUF4124 domain-containing protein [Pseudorhodoferax sp.]